ncbi:nuclear transport factor 2 family protein [Martelella radicis]|uniref:SnoaL-like domain-containing protein n=1 Tax=Martelella radicis TaxID=1397476 RepID=A0A7W6KI68_9HYPH|nr:nuclear transport factor 2 family protein [Martelella radicis]MBB4120649.1 hypothetical protein [Martelella radicis]
MKLPLQVQVYFDADHTEKSEDLLKAFAPDARVYDEGRTYVGHEAIASWWRASKEKYRAIAEPIELEEQGEVAWVRARVTGLFPGSPAMLTFAFRLSGKEITVLEIGA